MKNFFLKRLVAYPVGWGIAWYFIFSRYSDSSFIGLIKEQMDYMMDILPFSLSPSVSMILFGLGFGYVYGTGSILVRVSKLRGTLFIVMFLVKVLFSAFFAVSIGCLLYFLEILLFPIIIYGYKKLKKKKIPRVYKKESDQEDLIKEMERIVYEYRKSRSGM